MKILTVFAVACLLILSSCSPTGSFFSKSHYLDETGKAISEKEFQAKWRDKEIDLARWDVQTDSGRVAQLNAPVYEQYIISHQPFLRNMEKLTGRELDEKNIFLIEYKYTDDLCTSRYTNTWKKSTIRERKEFLTPVKARIEDQNRDLVYLHFFEEGIDLANDPSSEKEYFYQDSGNFLRKNLFRNPTLCGSFALVKPNGEVLIRNGERRPDRIAELLKPEYWNLFF